MTIQEVLSLPPENILGLSDSELQKLLEPFIPSTRLALLPPESPRKLGLERRAIKDGLDNMREELLETMRVLKEKEQRR